MEEFDLIVIGAGPGGYTAAVRAASSGLKVALVEQNTIGGVCLNVGCIPTKALIHIAEQADGIKHTAGVESVCFTLNKAAMNDKLRDVSQNIVRGVAFLLNKNNVTLLHGTASLVDAQTVSVGEQTLHAKYIILAIGSSNKNISGFLQNASDADKILDSTSALFLDSIPKTLTVIGGGAIGTELAFAYACLGTAVTLLEYQPTLLPGLDAECGKSLERAFKKQNIRVITGAKVSSIEIADAQKTVVYTRKDKTERVASEEVLAALGRQPNSLGGLDKVLPDCAGKFIPTDDKMRTNVPHIYAIGDIRFGTPQLAHVAYHEARAAVDDILNAEKGIVSEFKADMRFTPFCVYTEPQAAGFGMTEEQAKAADSAAQVRKLLMRANGRAVAADKADGFVKIITIGDHIVGAWIVGPQATEIIHEIIIAAKHGITVGDLADMMYAHPTISEMIGDTASI